MIFPVSGNRTPNDVRPTGSLAASGGGRPRQTPLSGLCQASGVLVLAIACALSAAAWVYLVAAHGGFWLTSQRLPAAGGQLAAWPAVAAVVPARNEAESLPVTLPALLAQDYPGPVTLVLVDDASTDGTTEVARDLAAQELARRAAARDAGDSAALGGVVSSCLSIKARSVSLPRDRRERTVPIGTPRI